MISPYPMYAEPSIWPSTFAGLSALPQSCAVTMRSTFNWPVCRSIVTSATHAWYEYAGLGPTPAPLKVPPIPGGGLYQPAAESVPYRASAATAASVNVRDFVGSSRS